MSLRVSRRSASNNSFRDDEMTSLSEEMSLEYQEEVDEDDDDDDDDENRGPDEWEPHYIPKFWVSCCGRFMYEVNPRQNWFLTGDPPFTGRTLDIARSFAPASASTIVSKALSLLTMVAALAMMVLSTPNKLFMLAYMSTWTALFSIVYGLLSVWNSFSGVYQPPSRASGRVRATWIVFAVSSHLGVMEAILFWTTEYDDDTEFNFQNSMLHGGIAFAVIMDGFTTNQIPLRWTNWYACLVVEILYVAWTLMHAYFLTIGNPDKEFSGLLYNEIDWRWNWWKTLIRVGAALFVFGPLIFLGLWLMSLYKWPLCFCCWGPKRERRYYIEHNPPPEPEEDEEEGGGSSSREYDDDDTPRESDEFGEDDSNSKSEKSEEKKKRKWLSRFRRKKEDAD